MTTSIQSREQKQEQEREPFDCFYGKWEVDRVTPPKNHPIKRHHPIENDRFKIKKTGRGIEFIPGEGLRDAWGTESRLLFEKTKTSAGEPEEYMLCGQFELKHNRRLIPHIIVLKVWQKEPKLELVLKYRHRETHDDEYDVPDPQHQGMAHVHH